MDEGVKKDILAVIKRTIEILEKEEEKDIFELEELSNHIIHSATIFQDEDSTSTAVLVYSIYKIIERSGRSAETYSRLLPLLQESYKELESDEIGEYRSSVKGLFKTISEIDAKFKKYVEEVMEKARIKKGTKIYEHGISIARVAEIIGISQWELMNYIGKTEITEVAIKEPNIENRLKYLRGIFK